MIPYSRQSVNKTDINYVVKNLKSEFITQGKKVIEFEDKLSKYTKSKFCCNIRVLWYCTTCSLFCRRRGINLTNW